MLSEIKWLFNYWREAISSPPTPRHVWQPLSGKRAAGSPSEDSINQQLREAPLNGPDMKSAAWLKSVSISVGFHASGRRRWGQSLQCFLLLKGETQKAVLFHPTAERQRVRRELKILITHDAWMNIHKPNHKPLLHTLFSPSPVCMNVTECGVNVAPPLSRQWTSNSIEFGEAERQHRAVTTCVTHNQEI